MPHRFGILFLGDIVGRTHRRAMDKFLPALIKKYSPSLVIANGENAAGGSGITEEIGKDLFMHVDVLTSGNHIWDKKEALPYLEREPRLLRPANYPAVNPGRHSYVFQAADGIKAAVLNLQGRVFMEPLDCPFKRADEEVAALAAETPIIVVDIHAEATSEKQALGWHLDGRGHKKLRYMPWPHPELKVDSTQRLASNQESRRIGYIGSFSKEKGADRLRLFLQALLEHTRDYSVTIVGPAIDDDGNDCVQAISDAGAKRVSYLPRISRADALALIRNSLAVVSPGSRLGWGLIGDAWNCGTPIIAAAEHYGLHDGLDCLIARQYNRLP